MSSRHTIHLQLLPPMQPAQHIYMPPPVSPEQTHVYYPVVPHNCQSLGGALLTVVIILGVVLVYFLSSAFVDVSKSIFDASYFFSIGYAAAAIFCLLDTLFDLIFIVVGALLFLAILIRSRHILTASALLLLVSVLGWVSRILYKAFVPHASLTDAATAALSSAFISGFWVVMTLLLFIYLLRSKRVRSYIKTDTLFDKFATTSQRALEKWRVLRQGALRIGREQRASHQNQNEPKKDRLYSVLKVAIHSARILMILALLLSCVASSFPVPYYNGSKYGMEAMIRWAFTILIGLFFGIFGSYHFFFGTILQELCG